MLRKGGYWMIAVPSKRHLYGLKEVLYKTPYENQEIDTTYDGFRFERRIPIRDNILLEDPKADSKSVFDDPLLLENAGERRRAFKTAIISSD